ncbi:CRISPR-associated endonuclease Cas2 [Chondromyces apiculatus]|uniref:CRISPR-associated endoribonuclease Cas2 n=1 Tax=Chondromyces apiculatus DSM 436 TaxID=1192034 RepID=A0A017T7U7_9BACT|nr:CRISPR-associated endonuclease Cas2 [Chondromyces apiculatus]EYF05343.1 CRISPR-associated protein Cas2 [Chondromyces apiculatus DSM 436]
MMIVICYDVATTDPEGPRRLRKIAAACKDHGVRVQYSVFECRLDDPSWVKLRSRLLKEYDAARDSLRFYYIRENDAARTEHHGVREPLNPGGPLVV